MSYLSDISQRFRFFVTKDPDVLDVHKQIRLTCEALAILIDSYIPDGREKDIALEKIEEASFWANAGLSRKHGVPHEGASV